MIIFLKYILCKYMYIYFLNTFLCIIFNQIAEYIALVQYHVGLTAYDSIFKKYESED